MTRPRIAITAALSVAAVLWLVYGGRGMPPLCQARTAAEVVALIRDGVDVNASSSEGCTALHFAAARGRPDVVKALLDAGAKPDVASVNKETPLHWAAKQFWDPDAGDHPIDPAFDAFDASTKAEAARLLLAAGADPNARDHKGFTPLFDAAFYDVRVVKVMLAAKADATARSVDGFSPLHLVADAEIAELLIAHGADPNATEKWEHRTPLDVARGDDVREVLIRHGGRGTR